MISYRTLYDPVIIIMLVIVLVLYDPLILFSYLIYYILYVGCDAGIIVYCVIGYDEYDVLY